MQLYSDTSKHPPFHGSASRFTKEDAPSSPDYHVAYQDTMILPEKRDTKGWTAMDDAIKPHRGTGTGKHFSSMAPKLDAPSPGSMLQPLFTTYPNETRLQELLDLQRRRLGQQPGPGQYQVSVPAPSKKCFRRQAIPQLDGPFVAPSNGMHVLETTRDREMAQARAQQPGSGVAPDAYNGHLSKDVVKKSAPASTIGTGARSGRTPHLKSLSVSRSIQHGIDWHVPVVVQIKPADAAAKPQALGAASSGAAHSPGLEKAGAASPSPQEALAEAQATAHHEDGAAEGASAQLRGQSQKAGPLAVGKPLPAPPAAVSRSVRRPVVSTPSDWDWQKLDHNYRNNWTTLHGGAYSHGDRSTARRDAKQPDAVDYMGLHTESFDPSALPVKALGDIFPIPEEYSDAGLSQHNGSTSLGETPLVPPFSAAGRSGNSSQSSRSASQYMPAAQGLGQLPPAGSFEQDAGAGAWGTVQDPESAAAMLLSRSELERHEAAMQAALTAKHAAARRAAWNTRALGVLA